jgi:hypothetical protein
LQLPCISLQQSNMAMENSPFVNFSWKWKIEEVWTPGNSWEETCFRDLVADVYTSWPHPDIPFFYLMRVKQKQTIPSFTTKK